MKLTKTELKAIIKEEIENTIPTGHSTATIEEAEALDESVGSILRNVMMYGPLLMKLVSMLKNNPKIMDMLKTSDAPETPAPEPEAKEDPGTGSWRDLSGGISENSGE